MDICFIFGPNARTESKPKMRHRYCPFCLLVRAQMSRVSAVDVKEATSPESFHIPVANADESVTSHTHTHFLHFFLISVD